MHHSSHQFANPMVQISFRQWMARILNGGDEIWTIRLPNERLGWYYAPPHSTIPLPTWCRQFIHVWPHKPVASTRGRAWIVSVTPRQYTMWCTRFTKYFSTGNLSKIKTILSFLVVLVKTFPSWSQPFIYVWVLLFSLQNYHELDSNGLSREKLFQKQRHSCYSFSRGNDNQTFFFNQYIQTFQCIIVMLS